MKNIVIVGSGPVALTTALGFAKCGVKTTILESKPGLVKEGSRAIVVDRGSLLCYNEFGIAREFVERGLTALRRRTFFRGRELYCNEFPAPDENGIPLFVNIPQTDTEDILLCAAVDSGLIDFKWGHRVTGVTQDGDTVYVDYKSHTGDGSLSCDYLVAADGANSSVRRIMGIDFPGFTNPYRFLIVDVRAEFPFQREHHFHFDAEDNPGHSLLLVPQPSNIWRIDFQIPHSQTWVNRHPDALSGRVRGVVGHDDFELIWASTYQFQQRLLKQFRYGKVFFAGDSAHLVNPFGARGMNSGVQDARHLVAVIQTVLSGEQPESFLDSYSTERFAANLEHQRITKRSMRFIAPPAGPALFARNAILRASSRFPKLRGLVDSGQMSKVDERTHCSTVCEMASRPARLGMPVTA